MSIHKLQHSICTNLYNYQIMNLEKAMDTLQTTSRFQLGAEKVLRYQGDPLIKGDNTAEHIARMARLAGYLMPYF